MSLSLYLHRLLNHRPAEQYCWCQSTITPIHIRSVKCMCFNTDIKMSSEDSMEKGREDAANELLEMSAMSIEDKPYERSDLIDHQTLFAAHVR